MAIAAGTVLATFSVPPGHKGVVKGFGIAITNPVRWDGTTAFQLRVNGHPYRDYAKMTIQLGSILSPNEVTIPVGSNTTVDIIVLNGVSIAVGETATARIKGWYWPENMD